jgi:hypothetical protein
MKLKLITGYREDQYHTIDISEAHKAYYLFLNPEQRGIFNNGLAIQGKVIQSIEPDYHSTMNWNKGYKLTAEDYAEINRKGIDTKFRDLMSKAKTIATTQKELLLKPMETNLIE